MSDTQPRVLVIDDEQAICRFLTTSLSVHSYQVFEAADGQAGLIVVIASRPDW